MNESPVQIPSSEVIAKIPYLSSDLSRLEVLTPEQIADCARSKKEVTRLQVSGGASSWEVAKLNEANALLEASGDQKIDILLGGDETNEITRDITLQIIENARKAFKDFILKVLAHRDNEPGSFIYESDEYIVGRYEKDLAKGAKVATNVDDMHFWANLGISKEDTESRRMVYEFVEAIADEFRQVLGEKILPKLKKHPVISDTREITRALIIAMLSNMTRGVYYYYAKPSEEERTKMYKPRHLAVEALKENGHIQN